MFTSRFYLYQKGILLYFFVKNEYPCSPPIYKKKFYITILIIYQLLVHFELHLSIHSQWALIYEITFTSKLINIKNFNLDLDDNFWGNHRIQSHYHRF